MGKRSRLLPEKYENNGYGFTKKLLKKTQFWSPNSLNEDHAIIQCIEMFSHGHLNYMKPNNQVLNNLFNKKIDHTYCFDYNELDMIAKYYKIQIYIYYEKSIYGGRKIAFQQKTEEEYEERIPILQSHKEKSFYALILPDKNGKINFINEKRYCHNHGEWIKPIPNWKHHIENCFRCQCGRQFNKGSSHSARCQKEHYDEKKRPPMRLIKKYSKDEGGVNIENCYFCDFETFIDNRDGKYVVYSASFIDSKEEDNPMCWIGKDSLISWLDHIIQNCDGIIWFFNGIRFDNFFLLRKLVEYRIPIVPQQTIIVGSNILSLGFETRKGSVVLKDLSKFLHGSLDANCKAFKLDQSKSKSDFNHDEVKSFDDAEKIADKIREYNNQDVIALKHVFLKYSTAVYDMYSLHASKYMTFSQLAYAAWTTTLRKKMIILKTKIEDEKIMRELYKGGRVHCGRPKWKSSQWKEIKASTFISFKFNNTTKSFDFESNNNKISKEMYDKIDDYYEYLDVNSLYPFAQIFSKYPYGKYQFHQIDEHLKDNIFWIDAINLRKKNLKKKVLLTAFEVDVLSPNNLSVPFLMTKNEKGEVEQNLLNKEKKWFTGPELWEASRLGYIITRIHNIITWPNGEKIFDEFVKKTYKFKKDSKKDSPIYVAVKNILNGLTGKYGQHSSAKSVRIFYPNEKIDENLNELTEIEDEDGLVLAWYASFQKDLLYTPFSIELSAWILGWSKVIMSRYLRKMGIEKSDMFCPLYMDTDSCVVHCSSFEKLDDKYKGDKELGQLKREIKGKIIAFFVLAPKTYCVIYVDEETFEIKSLIKSKGIPHSKDPFNAFGLYNSSDQDKKRSEKESEFLNERRKYTNLSKSFFSPTPFELKKCIYIFRKEGEIVHSSTKIPPMLIPKILKKDITLECIYGGMIRNFEPGAISNIFIARDSKSRTFNKSDWWSKGYRKLSEKDKLIKYPTAYAIGHEKYEWDYLFYPSINQMYQ